MKRRAFTLVEFIVSVLIVSVLASILLPVFSRKPPPHGSANCTSNLKQIGLGFIQYSQDYDEKFPPVSNSLGSWGELIFPYVKSDQVFQCPADDPSKPQTTDYFANLRLCDLSQRRVIAPALTLLAGDGTGDSPRFYNLSRLPNSWRTDRNSPAWRHLNAANYLFADGHVKSLRAEKITLQSPTKNHPTFKVR